MKLLHYNGEAGCKISPDAILNTGHFFLSAIKCLPSLNGREKSQYDKIQQSGVKIPCSMQSMES